MNKKRALIISSALVQDQEFVYPYYRLLEDGFNLDVCLIEGEPVSGFLGMPIPPNKNHKITPLSKISTKNYDFLVLPGGVKSMEKVRLVKEVLDFIYKFNKEKKIIACICSAAQLLISAKIVKGRKISGYYSMQDDITNAGAIYKDLPAVIDKNIITTAHYKDLGPWMKAALELYYKKKSK
jgi:protease I|tara:strand:- start:1224 stop:1766 length:543 start_codon:yes stop_codon:yes gene_type:complete